MILMGFGLVYRKEEQFQQISYCCKRDSYILGRHVYEEEENRTNVVGAVVV